MSKLVVRSLPWGSFYRFSCPGCKHDHVYTVRTDGKEVCWSFNGDLDHPTFSPSLLNTTETTRCHLFLTDGKLQFLGDCTHHLAGQTVDLPYID